MIHIGHNFDEVAADLRRAASDLQRQEPRILKLASGRLFNLVAADFKKKAAGGTGAGGIRWPRDKSGDKRTGRESGRLEGSLSVRIFDGGFEISFDAPYAKFFDADRKLIPNPLPQEWIEALEADIAEESEKIVQAAFDR